MLPRRPSRKAVSHLPLVSRWQVTNKAPFQPQTKRNEGQGGCRTGQAVGSDDRENYRRRRGGWLRRLAVLPGREAPLVERAHKNKEAPACGRSQFHSPVAGRSRGADSTAGSTRTRRRQQKLTARRRFFRAPEERGVGGREDDDDDQAAAAAALTTTPGYMRRVGASACASRAPLKSSSKHGSRAPPSPLLPMRPSIWRRTIF